MPDAVRGLRKEAWLSGAPKSQGAAGGLNSQLLGLRGRWADSFMSRLCMGVSIQGNEEEAWQGGAEMLLGLRPGR